MTSLMAEGLQSIDLNRARAETDIRGKRQEAEGHVGKERNKTMADMQISMEEQTRPRHVGRSSPLGCAACANRRPGWFCSLGSAVLADLELATSTISLPAQASLFTAGRGCTLPLPDLQRLSQADRRPA